MGIGGEVGEEERGGKGGMEEVGGVGGVGESGVRRAKEGREELVPNFQTMVAPMVIGLKWKLTFMLHLWGLGLQMVRRNRIITLSETDFFYLFQMTYL